MTATTPSAIETSTIFVVYGFSMRELTACQYRQSADEVFVPDCGETFRLGQNAFRVKQEAVEVLRARCRMFRL